MNMSVWFSGFSYGFVWGMAFMGIVMNIVIWLARRSQ